MEASGKSRGKDKWRVVEAKMPVICPVAEPVNCSPSLCLYPFVLAQGTLLTKFLFLSVDFHISAVLGFL